MRVLQRPWVIRHLSTPFRGHGIGRIPGRAEEDSRGSASGEVAMLASNSAEMTRISVDRILVIYLLQLIGENH